jgi:hypothetical protein
MHSVEEVCRAFTLVAPRGGVGSLLLTNSKEHSIGSSTNLEIVTS